VLHALGRQRRRAVEQTLQRRLDTGFVVPRRQVQHLHVLLGRTLRLLRHQHVVGQAEAAGRKQVATIAIVRERPRLTHQPVDHVPVVDAVLAATPQPRQRLDQALRVPHLQALGKQPRLDPLADQTAGHRVRVAFDVQRAAFIHPHLQAFARLQAACRQRSQLRQLLGQAGLPARVPLGK